MEIDENEDRKMKKRNMILWIIIVVVVIAVCVWLLVRPKALGNINASFAEQTTSISDFSFTAEKGDKIKFSFRSNITAGNLEIMLYDSNDNEVYVLDHAKALETFYTFDFSDTYTLKAIYTDFTDHFKIAVYPAKSYGHEK